MNLSSLPGTVLDGRYFIERQLGQGGMGAVFAAQHVGTTRTVAVKIIVPQLADQDEFLLRFQREAEAAGRLRHPNIVNVTDFGFTELNGSQIAYLVMEFLDGESLQSFLKHTPQPPMDLILEIVEQTALGLDAAHAAGIVHRDLKPDNIGLESNRRGGFNIKILDFGIAKLADPAAATVVTPKPASANRTSSDEMATAFILPDKPADPGMETVAISDSLNESDTAFIAPTKSAGHRMTGTSASTLQTTVGAVLGTPAFMPPEQCQGELVDHRADVYSLAVIAYQLFCGRLPFEARTVRELLEQQINSLPPAPHDLDKGISTGVSNAILKGLSKNPADRQSSTGMFAAQIRVGAQGEVGILNDGKFYSGAYSECFLPLVFACFSPLLILQVLTSLATGWLYREKLIPGPILLAFVNLFGFLQLMFLSQCYKAGCAMVLEDAASKGFFHPQVKAILAALVRQTGTLLRMFFSFSNWTSYSVFALWPSVWIAEKRVGRDAFERARQLGGVQPEATFALFARQLGIMLMASITSATLLVLMTGSAQEYATVLFSGGYFSIFFAIYPAMFTPMFLAFGAAFHFLYRSGRRCLGEEVSSNLPAGSRTKRPKTTSFVRPATLLWLMPPVLLVCAIAFRLLPQKASTISFIDAMNDGRRNFVLKNIDAGTPVDTADLRKRTPLMHAAIDGDVEGIRQLLARGAKIEARSSTGTTPLMLAISSRHHEAAKLLLDRGADPNAIDNEKRTALMIAAMHGDPDSCKLLLARGAKSEIRNGAGKSAIDFAMEEGHPETASILRESR